MIKQTGKLKKHFEKVSGMETSVDSFIERYKLLECIQCGVCTGSCPVSIKTDLNIRKLIHDIVIHRSVEVPPHDTLWSCTTCSTCEIRCPKGLAPVDTIVKLREIVVEKGRIASMIIDALESIYKHGNPWGRIRSQRSEWTDGLKVDQFSDEADLLYYVGCTAAYDPRMQNIAKSIVKILDTARVNFGTLGNEESCCGDPAYSIGERGLFELLLEDNKTLFEIHGVQHMITTSPHCYNAFKKRYDKINFEVQHYTQYIANLVDIGTLKLSKEIDKTIIFHDPCFLGKQNNLYYEPRKILENIPGVNLVEFERSREKSLCCEGGGGRMWIEVSGERLAEIRVREAVNLGAKILATSCPFCLSTLDDAVKTLGYDAMLEVMDVAEIVSEAI